jgi:hypothetical protein
MRIGVDRAMQFAPASAGADAVLLIEPFAFAVDLHSRAVDE